MDLPARDLATDWRFVGNASDGRLTVDCARDAANVDLDAFDWRWSSIETSAVFYSERIVVRHNPPSATSGSAASADSAHVGIMGWCSEWKQLV